MTWRTVHNYGEGRYRIDVDGQTRELSPSEARGIALELERYASALPVSLPDMSADYLVDPDVDFALFRDKNHPVVAVVKVPGGARLRCLACHVEGKRLYQDAETAQAYARMLSGVRVPAWPRCQP